MYLPPGVSPAIRLAWYSMPTPSTACIVAPSMASASNTTPSELPAKRRVVNTSSVAKSSFMAPLVRVTSAASRFGPHQDERLAAAFGDQLVVLIVGAVVKLDDAGAGAGFGFALADDLGRAMHGVVLEQRVGEFDLGHAEIGDRRADRHVGDLDADHQPEREQRVHQRLAPFGLLLAELPVDMQRLRIERHVGEQHVVHLGDGARIAVLDGLAGDEILEIEPAALVPDGCLLGHFSSPRCSSIKSPFTIMVNHS